MPTSDFQLTEDKYLFTFQDETKLWIPKKIIEKYQQLPFYDIIKHSEKYDDGSYYVDMPSSPMNNVIDFLMKENVDISSLNLRDSYDIYKALIEYSITIDKKIQGDLLSHVKDLFITYLKDNNYRICCDLNNFRYMPMTSYKIKKIQMRIKDDYASNIPLEYICPSCIQDIFPSLKEIMITVTTHYKKTELLLNPNSDEYIMEYNRLLYKVESSICKRKKHECYTESEMNEYNKISSLDLNKIYYSQDLIDSYNKRRNINQLPKLYTMIINEAIYTDDYSQIEINETEDEYTFDDVVTIGFSDNTNYKTFCIDIISTKLGISQLLRLSSFYSISKMVFDTYYSSQYKYINIVKSLEEGVFDSLTTFSIYWIKELTYGSDKNIWMKIMASHIFPNVTELIYDDVVDHLEYLFPMDLLSIINTIHICQVNETQNEKLALLLDNIAYTHSICIDGMVDSSNSENIKKLDYFENYKRNIDCLDIKFKINRCFLYNSDQDNQNEINIINTLKKFLSSNILQNLNSLTVSFDSDISLKYLKLISNIFHDNKINTIHKLKIKHYFIKTYSPSDYFDLLENTLENLVPKASIISIEWLNDICDDSFFKIFTINNFPQLKSLKICKYDNREWLITFINGLCKSINNSNFPSSCIIQLSSNSIFSQDDYIYDSNASIFQYKYNMNSFINTIIGTKNDMISKFEIETIFDCIKENKIQRLRSFKIYIYDEEQLSKLINFITIGKFPKLEDFIICIKIYILPKHVDMYKQQLKESSFIHENHIHYQLKPMTYF
ncbi:hypothetical protein WA158_000627 [Blastocystis sp. Blastoise]